MESIHTLLDRLPPAGSPPLPGELCSLYGGDLRFPHREDRPYTIANFVSTLDGVVSYNIPGKSGGPEISGFNQADRFIMGLLRASADAILVGSHTFHATDPADGWTAESVYPEAKDLYARYRRQILNKPEYPALVIVTGSGTIDFERVIFSTPEARIVIVTGPSGDREIQRRLRETPTSASITPIAVNVPITPSAITALLWSKLGVHLLLLEGGPNLLGQVIAAGGLDELFLTLSPQIAGNLLGQPRLGLVAGVEFSPESAPWLQLLSAKQAGDHLFLRYRSQER